MWAHRPAGRSTTENSMAMFREHIAIGAIVSMVAAALVYFYALVTDPLLLTLLFGTTVVGSFLPDVDSDSGMPFYLVFGTTTVVATGLVLLYVLSHRPENDYLLVGIPAASLLFFWFVVGGIIKRFTHHRGIYHSIPAMGIAGLLTYIAATQFGLDAITASIFGLCMGAGFASHLVLDELHSGVSSDGIPFFPKRSLGTALKFLSDSRKVNVATYSLLAGLLYIVTH